MNSKRPAPLHFYPQNRQEWREWLMHNHRTAQSIWLVYYKKNTGKPSLVWSEAVDEALCFGWIDSTAKSIDDEQYIQLFSVRKPNSTWSKINKDKIKQLIAAGLMTEAGLASIERAKQNGSWSILDEVEELIIPQDLEKAFKAKRGSKAYFMGLSQSVRKAILQWLVLAKRAETRLSRINEIVESSAQQLKPKPFR